MPSNPCIKLAAKATGLPGLQNFRYDVDEQPVPKDGEALIRVDWISIDPYLITRIKSRENYAPGVDVGDVMEADAIGQVIQSNWSERAVGDMVMGSFGMQSFALDGPDAESQAIAPLVGETPKLALTLINPGLTAYFGLLDIGRPTAGETVLVSAGAGSVGSIVAAIAKIKKCRAVAVVGSDDKINYCIETLGYAAAVNRKDPAFPKKLKEACPGGVDVFFDNTGGPIYDEAIKVMNIAGRIIACGRIAGAQFSDPAQDIGPRDTDAFIVKRLAKKGFLVSDYEDQETEAIADLLQWHKEGAISVREDILEGVENAPAAFMRLISGENVGKQLVRVKH
ncbi:MAG: NADP-dependent oxidoreductase [Pseudomonadota bacterium]